MCDILKCQLTVSPLCKHYYAVKVSSAAFWIPSNAFASDAIVSELSKHSHSTLQERNLPSRSPGQNLWTKLNCSLIWACQSNYTTKLLKLQGNAIWNGIPVTYVSWCRCGAYLYNASSANFHLECCHWLLRKHLVKWTLQCFQEHLVSICVTNGEIWRCNCWQTPSVIVHVSPISISSLLMVNRTISLFLFLSLDCMTFQTIHMIACSSIPNCSYTG